MLLNNIRIYYITKWTLYSGLSAWRSENSYSKQLYGVETEPNLRLYDLVNKFGWSVPGSGIIYPVTLLYGVETKTEQIRENKNLSEKSSRKGVNV